MSIPVSAPFTLGVKVNPTLQVAEAARLLCTGVGVDGEISCCRRYAEMVIVAPPRFSTVTVLTGFMIS